MTSVPPQAPADAAAVDAPSSALHQYERGLALLMAARRQDAVDAFEAVRAQEPVGPLWLNATDQLARLLLAAQMHDVVVVLSDQLLAGGAPAAYCAWLRARALPHLGDTAGAWALMTEVSEVYDLAGALVDPVQVAEVRGLLRDMAALTAAGPA